MTTPDPAMVCDRPTCRWAGPLSAVLRAPHPFQEGAVLSGCPSCREAETITTACDEPGCNRPADCGTPTPNGYRWTCSRHRPRA